MKAGILSLYYDNANYGGLLQAYALTTALSHIDIQGEQICFDSKESLNPLAGTELTKKEKIKKYGMRYIIFSVAFQYKMRYKKIMMRKVWVSKEHKERLAKRKECLKFFEQHMIPHSDKVYKGSDIFECVKQYDFFICGSDQVWNPSLIRDEYLLKFVPEGKKKIAYAASISRDMLTEFQKSYICNCIKNFSAISVREKTAITLLSDGLLKDRVLSMPDPTFLLTRNEWERLIEKEENFTLIEEEYILCYFLGGDISHRRVVRTVAQKCGLKTVGFPHVSGNICYADDKIGYDIEEYECSPSRFINLIKHAKFIVTDSFHATVFSILFKKDFVAFKRENASYGNSMFSRLADLLEDFGLESRIVGNRVHELTKKMSIACNFDIADKRLEEERKRGMLFLENSVDKRG